MTVYLDIEMLLALAEQVPGDPQPDDYGILVAACARHQAVLLGRDVYGSATLQAAALIDTIVKLRPMPTRNATFAWYAAVGFLELNGVVLDASPAEVSELVRAVRSNEADLPAVSANLSSWAK